MMMKSFQLIVSFLAIGYVSLVQGNLGTMSCKGGNLHPDAQFEKTMGVTCPPDVSHLDSVDFNQPMSEPDLEKALGLIFGGHFKCMCEQIKAVDPQGKIIPTKMAGFHNVFQPADFHKKMKTEIDNCVKKHNPQLKKEVGHNGKSWGGMILCWFDGMDKSCPQK